MSTAGHLGKFRGVTYMVRPGCAHQLSFRFGASPAGYPYIGFGFFWCTCARRGLYQLQEVMVSIGIVRSGRWVGGYIGGQTCPYSLDDPPVGSFFF